MNRLATTLAAAAILSVIPLAGLCGQRIAVPGGTPITIRMVDTVSSRTAQAGDNFEFKTDGAIVLNGYVVIPSGAAGRGTVLEVDRAAGNGHSGRLKLQFDYVYAADGEKIKLTDIGKTRAASAEKGKSSTATMVGYLVLGPVGLFAHNWVKGKEFVLDSSKPFTVFTDSTVHVVATQRAAAVSGDGFAH